MTSTPDPVAVLSARVDQALTEIADWLTDPHRSGIDLAHALRALRGADDTPATEGTRDGMTPAEEVEEARDWARRHVYTWQERWTMRALVQHLHERLCLAEMRGAPTADEIARGIAPAPVPVDSDTAPTPEPETVPCDACDGSGLLETAVDFCDGDCCRCPRRGCAAEPGKPAGRLRTFVHMERGEPIPGSTVYVYEDGPDRIPDVGQQFLWRGQVVTVTGPYTFKQPVLVPAPSPVGATAVQPAECICFGPKASSDEPCPAHLAPPAGATAEDRDSDLGDELAAGQRAVELAAQFMAERDRAVAYADTLREGVRVRMDDALDRQRRCLATAKEQPDHRVHFKAWADASRFYANRFQRLLIDTDPAAPAPVPSPEEPTE